MVKSKIKKGDLVRVITGDDKGKKGLVIKAMPSVSKLLVEGVNIVKKHKKPTAQDTQGSIVQIEAPIHISNVTLVDPKNPNSTKATKIGRRRNATGKIERYIKTTGDIIK